MKWQNRDIIKFKHEHSVSMKTQVFTYININVSTAINKCTHSLWMYVLCKSDSAISITAVKFKHKTRCIHQTDHPVTQSDGVRVTFLSWLSLKLTAHWKHMKTVPRASQKLLTIRLHTDRPTYREKSASPDHSMMTNNKKALWGTLQKFRAIP